MSSLYVVDRHRRSGRFVCGLAKCGASPAGYVFRVTGDRLMLSASQSGRRSVPVASPGG
jgi:hypothetical protein